MGFFNKPIRVCKLCKLEAYTIDDCEELFLKDKKVKTGYRNMCKSCRRKQYQEYEKQKEAKKTKRDIKNTTSRQKTDKSRKRRSGTEV